MALFLKNRVKNQRMPGIIKLCSALLFIFILTGCSKKAHPSQTPGITVIVDSENITPSPDVEKTEEAEKKAVSTSRKTKPVFPNIITVNDKAAKKSTDGRLYYDVMGHRYWKNYKDGKYYLYNKSMYKNPDFKNPESNN